MKDLVLKCQNCGNEFVFSSGEQSFYATNKLPTPTYCLICRSIKKQEVLRPKKPQT